MVNSKEYAAVLKRGGRTVTYMGPAAAQELVDSTATVMKKYLPLIKAAQASQPKKKKKKN